MSDEPGPAMSTPRVLIVSGPSGVGKSSVLRAVLARRPDVQMTISTTTRAPRPGETDGVDYHFVDTATFERTIAAGGFLEWARSYDNLYGTGVREIERILAAGGHALLDIDTQGALQIQAAYRGAVYLFIKPPDLATLERRLRGRNTEAEDVLRKRLDRAEQEIAHADQYDYVLVNHVVEDAVREFIAIIDREKERPVSFERIAFMPADAVTMTADKAARYALERMSQDALVQSLEADVKTALRGELEGLIRERLQRVLREDLPRIVEEAYRQVRGR
jgi:guanylate kinase